VKTHNTAGISRSPELERSRRARYARIVADCKRARISPDETLEALVRELGALSQAEIGKVLGLTRQRVQQIETVALRKLARMRMARELLRETG
jgi:DNA-directed RNA polymerase sigma subunit (sigma70/sigma32)